MIQKPSKHIVLLTPGFAANEKDTSCIPPLQLLALELSKILGVHNITIVAMHYPLVPCRYKWNGINVISIGANNVSFPKRFLFWKQLRKTLNTILSEKGQIRIHTFWYAELAYLTEKWSKKNEISHSVTIMGQEAKKGNRYVSRTKIGGERIVSLSLILSDLFLKNYGIKPDVNLCFGIDDIQIKKTSKRYDIVGVGSLVEVKNYHKFLDVISRVQKVHSDIKVCIVGDGALKDDLEKKVKELDLLNNVEFTGLLKREQSIQKIAESKLLLHTSNYESLGFIYLEAMKQKVKIVSTPVGIAPEFNGVKTSDNVEALCEYVLDALLDNKPANYPEIPSVRSNALKYINFWQNLEK